ncbi:ATP-binding protein [Mastigocoleus sp. MO_188.B34]|uniref:PAS domain-containing sensor histidine kinase n=1 Tax=Mastigocoleus sp. MO_188.B34 TaxID=3036635 RepID=UPI00262B675C|nr:ATP-binding protein [Mastigocoleus sp. MO_188.B34]MDJ0696612.1 PAS domain S-box protein [Mastigocoleus sp. MO_188.B34]
MHHLTPLTTVSEQTLGQLEIQVSLLKVAIGTTPDWIFIKDENLSYILANESYARAVGQTVTSIIGKDDLELGFSSEFVSDDSLENIPGSPMEDLAVLRGEIITKEQDIITLKDGSKRIFQTRKQPLRNSQGQIFAILGFYRDITEHCQVQKHLQNILIHQNKDITEANIPKKHLANVSTCISSEKISSQPIGLQPTNLQAIKLQTSYSSSLFSQANLEASIKSIESQQVDFKLQQAQRIKQAQRILEKVLPRLGCNEQRYHSLILASAQLVWTADRQGQIQDVLTRRKDSQITLLEIKGDEWKNLLYPEDRDCISQAWQKALNSQKLYQEEMGFRTKQGEYRHFLVRTVPIFTDNGHIREWVAVCIDIQDRKQVETELQQKAWELEQTLQKLNATQNQLIQNDKMSSLGQLVAGVAHEINNPVNFIYGNLNHADGYIQDLLGLLQIYEKHYPNPVQEVEEEAEAIDLEFMRQDLPKLISSMKMGAQRIREIILSLRNFSRSDDIEQKEVDIHEGIDSTLMILQHRFKAKPEHVGILVEKHYSDLPLVECYPGQLNQVFMNILSNALDALEERDQKRSFKAIKENPSRICICTKTNGSDKVVIRISDNGPGISEEVKKRIFEPFFTTKPVGKGTGLGMSISHQIIAEKHGGCLQCNSLPGKGSEFLIEIPLQQN